jgi:hypothetical protein
LDFDMAQTIVTGGGISATNFLRAHSVRKDAAVGLTAVLWKESRLNPASQGNQPSERGGILNPEGAYGIASWNGPGKANPTLIGDVNHDRQAALRAFAEKKGLPVDAVGTQLWFILNEAANKYPKTWAALNGTGDFKAVIRAIVEDYERPADPEKEIKEAIAAAEELYPNIAEPLVAIPEPPPEQPPLIVKPPELVDNEIDAMLRIVAILVRVPGQERIVSYLYNRFVESR